MTDTPKSIPPAGSLQVLSADMVYLRAKELLSKLACGSWEPAEKLRAACQAYEEIRCINVVKANETSVESHCELCRHVGHCLAPHEPNCEQYDPATKRGA